MAKFIFVVVLMAIVAATVMAAPAEEFEPLELSEGPEEYEGQAIEAIEEQEDHLRFRRVTCDLLSWGGVVGDSACAANCLSMGKAGGRCNDGVCQCRKTTFKNLWDKRFG